MQYAKTGGFAEVHGFSGNQGMVNLEGVRLRPRGRPSKTLMIYMHPASTLQLLPVPRAAVAQGAHVLCAASRYAKNDAPLILEKVVLDLGAYVRHARERWGYEKVVLVGWSGGGSLASFYQAQAERPTITRTAAGDPVDITGAGLIPADAVIFQAAHLSRARLLADAIDPSMRTSFTRRSAIRISTSTIPAIPTGRHTRRISLPPIGRRRGSGCSASPTGPRKRWWS